MERSAAALWYTGPMRAEIRETPLPPMRQGWAEVRTLHSALSRGTERLVAAGGVPESEWDRMRAPFQEGEFPYPVKYGYAAVGVVEDGPEALLGRTVFALHPHQDRFRLPAAALVPVPEGVPAARAVLAANAETALNAIWDARIVPGERVAILGAGLLGCLIGALLAGRDDLNVILADVIGMRREIAAHFRLNFATPTALPDDRDLAFHTSATAAGFRSALDCLAFEGRMIELSWYGDTQISVGLGGAFHSRRLTIRSSQVGHVAVPRRASTSHRDRLVAALDALADPRIDRLVTGAVPFEGLDRAIPALLRGEEGAIATRIDYR